MRKHGKIDSCQVAIVRDLRKVGASVSLLSNLGGGIPDLLVGWRGNNYLFECKNPLLPPSKQRLTPDEYVFHRTWNGQVSVVQSAQDCIDIMSLSPNSTRVI